MRRISLLLSLLFLAMTVSCCDSIMFKRFVEEYFSTTIAVDSLVELENKDLHKWELVPQDTMFAYASKYFIGQQWTSWQSCKMQKYYLLNFCEEVEKDMYGIVNTKFLLCDVCGNIMDTLFLEEVATKETSAFDKFSEYYVNKNGFDWILYDGIKETNYRELLCIKTHFIVENGKIIRGKTSQYRKENDLVW